MLIFLSLLPTYKNLLDIFVPARHLKTVYFCVVWRIIALNLFRSGSVIKTQNLDINFHMSVIHGDRTFHINFAWHFFLLSIFIAIIRNRVQYCN